MGGSGGVAAFYVHKYVSINIHDTEGETLGISEQECQLISITNDVALCTRVKDTNQSYLLNLGKARKK